MFSKLFYLYLIITNIKNKYLTYKCFYKNTCNYIIINVINFKNIHVRIYFLLTIVSSLFIIENKYLR